MAAAAEVLQILKGELSNLIADDFARQALASKVEGVMITNGPSREARAEDGVLRLTVPLESGATERYDSAALSAALNKLL